MAKTAVLIGALWIALTGPATAAPQCRTIKLSLVQLNSKGAEVVGGLFAIAMLDEGFSREQIQLVLVQMKKISSLDKATFSTNYTRVWNSTVEYSKLENHILELAGCPIPQDSQSK